MARKTNKTDHVLSLLSSGGKDKTEEKNTGAPRPPVEPDKDKSQSTVSIVQSSSEKEGLAESIKNSLEEEIEEMEKMQPEPEQGSAQVPDEIVKPQPETAYEEPTPERESVREEEVQELRAALNEAMPEQEASPKEKIPGQEAAPKEAIPKQEAVAQKAETGRDEEAGQAQEEEFAYINVMERLVKEKVLDYMEQFGNCTCSRCEADTTALALTQLPPKYVVINKETVSPLMNFYTKKFAGQITVEITKACIRVGEVPHHARD